jgi:hypothetical protein
LGGRYALLSNHFYYFGDKPIKLPLHLKAIACETQGHRSSLNDKYVAPFIGWMESRKLKPNKCYGIPMQKLERQASKVNCASQMRG